MIVLCSLAGIDFTKVGFVIRSALSNTLEFFVPSPEFVADSDWNALLHNRLE